MQVRAVIKIGDVDEYFLRGCGRCQYFDSPACKVHRWTAALAELRRICLEVGLTEELKWSHPVYTRDGKNIALIGSFNAYCCLSFFKGALLEDKVGILSRGGENTQSGGIFRVTDLGQVRSNEDHLRAYLAEAVAIEKSGRKVQAKAMGDYQVPDELTLKFEVSPTFHDAFRALTPGRQKAYLLHFMQAKQSATRASRIEKQVDRILRGKGLNDV